MELAINVLCVAVGLAGGAAGYRYWLKKDPARLEALAQQIKALRKKVEDKAS
jgi:hypothetical protein